MQYVLSRGFKQQAIVGRDGNGVAATRDPKRPNVFAPKLWEYGVPFSVWEGQAAGKNWTVCLVPDGVVLPAAALADPDIQVLSAASRSGTLTTNERNSVESKIAATDFGALSVKSTDSLDDVITTIRRDALGHAMTPAVTGAKA